MTKNGNEPLRINQFATVVSDKRLKDTPLRRGDQVLILAYNVVPAKRNDPYLQRALVIVAKVEDDLVQIPDNGNDYMTHLIDPRSLEWVGEERQRDGEQKLYTQFGPTGGSA